MRFVLILVLCFASVGAEAQTPNGSGGLGVAITGLPPNVRVRGALVQQVARGSAV
jgi:hypothetical protein